MASATGRYLGKEKCDSIVDELKSAGIQGQTEIIDPKKDETRESEISHAQTSFGTGCLACGEDDDHANLLICEGCMAEYHTYCLSPPLRSVPTSDWYCPKCKVQPFEDDGLDKLVSALSPPFTSRFGEICWAQGGVGFGWWPACVYDPRLTVGNARQLARKNLGKRHLVYFFECHGAPFDCLPDSKISNWEAGLLDDFHMGKTAKAAGRARTQLFQQALQAAMVEAGKPIEFRMDFNHTDQPQILPSPKAPKPKRKIGLGTKKRPREACRDAGTAKDFQSPERQQSRRGFCFLPESTDSFAVQPQVAARRNLMKAIGGSDVQTNWASGNPSEDDALCCKLLRATSNSEISYDELASVGFIYLPSKRTSTFAHARIAIEEELVPDCIPAKKNWRFFVPTLGPMSRKQESTLGPILPFLKGTTTDTSLGKGNRLHPLKIVIQGLENSSK